MRFLKWIALGMTALTVVVCILYFEPVKQAVRYSLAEDFRIKESLGKLFLVEKAGPEATTVASAAVAQAAYRKENGALVYACRQNEAVYAVSGGTVETVSQTAVTLRHGDGALSRYSGVGALCRAGEQVERGDVIGYALGEVTYRKYLHCRPVEPEA